MTSTRRGRPPHPDVLTPTEWRVVEEVRRGRSNPEIAASLGVSVNTVRYHVSNIFTKLGFTSRRELEAWQGRPRRRREWALAFAPLGWRGAAAGVVGVAFVGAVLAAFTVLAGERAGTEESAQSPVPPAQREGMPGLALVHGVYWNTDSPSGGYRFLLTPLDAATGEDLDGYAPLDVWRGAGIEHVAASPDGAWLAMSEWRTGTLTVVDLVEWSIAAEVIAEPSGIAGYLGLDRLQWSDDSKRLFAWRSYCSPAGCPHDIVDELWEIAPETGAGRVIGGFEFRRAAMAVAPAGERVYVLADSLHGDPGVPQPAGAAVVAIDTVSGDILGEVPLPSLKSGLAPGLPPFDGPGYANYKPALALHGSRLYVADADEERVTVIDLDSMQVERVVDYADPGSALSRFGAWLRSQVLGRAEAMPAQGWERSIAVSADGSRLFISGWEGGWFECPAGVEEPRCHRYEPAGLTVIDTTSFHVVLRESAIARFDVTPGGRWLLARGSDNGVLVFALPDLEVEHHLWRGEQIGQVFISPDGRHAYRRTSVLEVIDLERGEVVAERLLGEGHGLISLAAR